MSSSPVIEARGLSKRYLLTHQERYVALRDRLTFAYAKERFFGREQRRAPDEFWALRDVSFDVRPGEALGVVGKNGAGKSTLLKILSRITSPTSGTARIRGKMASLLEVGTGFHPELTGRENIFLNGAILGMKRRDIVKHFDAIVAFAGVERFLDTPVKRYSSGMYVRLAFAVAAHLEPEILVIDEVLAVGDAEFQKKCLGKMQDVANKDGRTILFVSHNMTAIQSLCRRAIWLDAGQVVEEGEAPRVVASYLRQHGAHKLEQSWPEPADAPGNEQIRVRSVRLVPRDGTSPLELSVKTAFDVELEFWNLVPGAALNVSIELLTIGGDCVFTVGGANGSYDHGLFRVSCAIPAELLNDGTYTANMYVIRDSSTPAYVLRDALTFQLNDVPRPGAWMDKWPGAVRPTFIRWDSTRLDEVRLNGESRDHAEVLAESRG